MKVNRYKIKIKMAAAGISTRQLIRLSGLAPTTIYAAFSGKKTSQTTTVYAICKALGCSVEDIVDVEV